MDATYNRFIAFTSLKKMYAPDNYCAPEIKGKA